MEKSRAIELLKLAVPIKALTQQEYSDFVEAVNMAIDALKEQLSKEGATSDLISKTETVKHLRRMLEFTVPNTDYDEGYIDGIEFGISTVSTMLPAQSQSTAGQLNDSAQSTNLIDRQAAIDGKIIIQRTNGVEIYYDEAVPVGYLKRLPTVQPEPTYEQVEEYCKRRCLHVVTADFFESTKPQRLGHWIQYDKRFPWRHHYKCSECGNYLDFTGVNGGRGEANYCPHCGTKMKGIGK